MTLDTEVSSLRQVPLFRGVEPSRLKLLAFTSERVHFEAGQQLFARGDAADAIALLVPVEHRRSLLPVGPEPGGDGSEQ